ncbi:pyridoxamine 5-phosphate oxidase [Sesbania bispinosa]|nr:pyridoxamine 5-phosphate oxidase [Sesbania bispinosa]
MSPLTTMEAVKHNAVLPCHHHCPEHNHLDWCTAPKSRHQAYRGVAAMTHNNVQDISAGVMKRMEVVSKLCASHCCTWKSSLCKDEDFDGEVEGQVFGAEMVASMERMEIRRRRAR